MIDTSPLSIKYIPNKNLLGVGTDVRKICLLKAIQKPQYVLFSI
ncbi:hypothetical protein ADIARSV_2861 [Arcticibacter svalbardensis MN12-7]|uniref:Uncharacterized protein n=1 Tax=Arcticibacter svalbardensis MN12-7 TaxID=1150600 RepID=R9GQB4_9SPHI|nr:hypothetical protein ADIARSV_2861 [Arcticibacter svalbardensis MN12-7]